MGPTPDGRVERWIRTGIATAAMLAVLSVASSATAAETGSLSWGGRRRPFDRHGISAG